MDGNRCESVIVESVSGKEFFGAKMVIDTTGDASIMHRAGVPTIEGANFMSYVAHYYDMEAAQKFAKDKDAYSFRKWMSIGSDLFVDLILI